MDARFLSVGEVALLLGMSNKWVYRHKAELPGFFKLAGTIFFDREILLSSCGDLIRKSAKSVRPSSPMDKYGLTS